MNIARSLGLEGAGRERDLPRGVDLRPGGGDHLVQDESAALGRRADSEEVGLRIGPGVEGGVDRVGRGADGEAGPDARSFIEVAGAITRSI